MGGPTTQWGRMQPGREMSKFLRGTHSIYSRLLDGDHIFTVLPNGKTPSAGDGGYFDLYTAFKAKGMQQLPINYEKG